MNVFTVIGAIVVAFWALGMLVFGGASMLSSWRRRRARRPAPQVICLATMRALREVDGRRRR